MIMRDAPSDDPFAGGDFADDAPYIRQLLDRSALLAANVAPGYRVLSINGAVRCERGRGAEALNKRPISPPTRPRAAAAARARARGDRTGRRRRGERARGCGRGCGIGRAAATAPVRACGGRAGVAPRVRPSPVPTGSAANRLSLDREARRVCTDDEDEDEEDVDEGVTDDDDDAGWRRARLRRPMRCSRRMGRDAVAVKRLRPEAARSRRPTSRASSEF